MMEPDDERCLLEHERATLCYAGTLPPDRETPGYIYYQYGTEDGMITRPWVKIDGQWR